MNILNNMNMDWQILRLGLGLGDDEKHGFTWDRDKEVLRWIQVHHKLHSSGSRHDVMWQHSAWFCLEGASCTGDAPSNKVWATVCNMSNRDDNVEFTKYHANYYNMRWGIGFVVLLLAFYYDSSKCSCFNSAWRPQVSLLLEPGSLPKPQEGNVTEKSRSWTDPECLKHLKPWEMCFMQW